MWEKIKSFFGFCTKKEKPVEYKTEPDIKDMEPTLYDEVEEKIIEVVESINTATEVKKEVEVLKTEIKKKVKRHWYNNGKHNRLIAVDAKVPKGYKKGRIRKKGNK